MNEVSETIEALNDVLVQIQIAKLADLLEQIRQAKKNDSAKNN